MTKFILHGGDTSDINVDNDNFFKEFGKELKDNGKILLNYFARDEHEWDRLAKEDQDRISRLNKNKEIRFEIAKEDIFEKQIRLADVIYFRGGDTYKLLEILKKIKKLESLFEGKIIIGSSAGACVLGKYFYDNDYDKFDEGLGFVNFKIFCHYDESCLELVKKLDDYKEKTEMLLLPSYEHKIIYKSDSI